MSKATAIRQSSTAPHGAAASQYLTFRLEGEMFALGIRTIREIIEYQAPTRVPMMPSFVKGVLNLRGAVVPVVDLAARFGWPSATIDRRSCIVIVEVQMHEATRSIGVVVDAVSEVLEIAGDQIEAAPSFGASVSAEFILGMGRVAQGFLIILDVNRLLDAEDIVRLAKKV